MSKYIDVDKLKAAISDDVSRNKMFILKLIDTLQQEQPEPTCKTCDFYENDCPFTRGKLMVYPNRVCKDYTCSAMKEQSQVADASKMEQPDSQTNLIDADAVREDFMTEVYRVLDADPTNDRANAIIDAFDSLPTVTLVQPDVDLKKEIDACWQNWLSPSNQKEVEGILPKTEFEMYAHHFYELGKNARKEE